VSVATPRVAPTPACLSRRRASLPPRRVCRDADRVFSHPRPGPRARNLL